MEENKFVKVLESSGMNLKQFSEYFGIPYRTVQNWKNGQRSCPDYILELLEYKIERENLKGQEEGGCEMQTIKIYCNYGVTGEEKRNVYTYGGEHGSAVCSDVLTVEIPKGWKLRESAMGNKIVEAPWGWAYEIGQVLCGKNHPCFGAINKDGVNEIYALNIVEND